MCITTLNYKVHWQYLNPIKAKESQKHQSRSVKRAIICLVKDKKGNLLSYGEAKCSPRDNYNKNQGRRISLERALNPFDKKERQEIWESYVDEIIK